MLASLLLAFANFAWPNFSSAANLKLVKHAAIVQSLLRLTPAEPDRRGAAWFHERQALATGFQTTFQFRLTGQARNEFGGADGFAFVIQNHSSSALADGGGSGGFAPAPGPWSRIARTIPHSVAVFFDTYRNPESGDPSGNYIGVYTNGKRPNGATPEARVADTGTSLAVDLQDGEAHTAKISYSPGRLAVYLDDLAVPLLVAPLDLAAITGDDGKAWAGFTAGTGGGYQNHDILSWSFQQGSPEPGLACLPRRILCTPDRPIIEQRAPGEYHIVLPANLEQGAEIPNPQGEPVTLSRANGAVCWDPGMRGAHGCNGVNGSSVTPSRNLGAPEEFLAPGEPAGSLLHMTENGRTLFSVNDRRGGFRDNEGYFEFDVRVGPPPVSAVR